MARAITRNSGVLAVLLPLAACGGASSPAESSPRSFSDAGYTSGDNSAGGDTTASSGGAGSTAATDMGSSPGATASPGGDATTSGGPSAVDAAAQAPGEGTDGERGTAAGSAGCGQPGALESGTFTIDVDGLAREYTLDVPANYDPNHAYPLVFVWHPLGGSAQGVVRGGYDGLKPLADGAAIFVAPNGLQTTTSSGIPGQGFRNEGGRDVAFLKAMLAHFNGNLCLDQGRVFSTGFSFGGMMSYAIGCELADVFRAIAPSSGNSRGSGCDQTTDHPIAVLGLHGDRDNFVETAGGRTARDIFVARNHCQLQTEPTEPAPCVAYRGCDDGYPVVWCEFPGAHQPWSEAPELIWSFFSQFY